MLELKSEQKKNTKALGLDTAVRIELAELLKEDKTFLQEKANSLPVLIKQYAGPDRHLVTTSFPPRAKKPRNEYIKLCKK